MFQLERIEYKGVGIDREGIEVGAGEKLTDVRLIVEYGAITVHGKVTINGSLPEGLKLRLVVSRQGDAPPVFKDTDVDEQGRFVVTNLSAGVYTFRLRPLPSRTLGENYKVIFEAVRREEQKVVVSENNQQPIALTLDLNR